MLLAANSGARARLWELLVLYVAAPSLIALFSSGRRWIVLPVILAGGLLSAWLLRREPARAPRDKEPLEPWQRALWPLLLRVTLVSLLLLLLLTLMGTPPTFRMPRERPLVWLGVLALYPFLSALPQELMYRSLFFHRYASLFRTDRVRLVANGLLFGWAHLLVHNQLAIALAAVAGMLLAHTWQRSQSLWLVTVEHSLYGALVFTAGVGGMFVNGVRLVSAAFH